MANEPTEDLTTDESDAEQQPAPPEPEKKDDEVAGLKSTLSELTGRLAQMQESYNVLLANQAAGNQDRTPAAEPTLEDVPEEEFQAAIEAGDGRKLAQLTRRQSKIDAERTARATRGEMQQLAGMVNTGIETLSDQALAVANMERNEKGEPRLRFAKRFAPQINETISKLHPGVRTKFETIKRAHDMYVGENFDTLVEEEIERRTRSKMADPGVGPTARRGAEKRIPQPEDVGGVEVLGELARHGGKDRFAQKMGYKDWDDYATQCIPAGKVQ